MELSDMQSSFSLLELPSLVLEKIIAFITDPLDLQALRRTCPDIKSIIDRNPEILVHLKVTPKDLKDLEILVNSETHIKWSNLRFPPELYYYVGCRRDYVKSFNGLFSSLADTYGLHIKILEMDRFDCNNDHHIGLLRKCQKLSSFKVDAMMLRGVKEDRIKDFLEDREITTMLNGLEHLDVTVVEFLVHDYQFQFMGKLLQKCTNLRTLAAWGYFPEWEHPTGGTVHLKYFVWPLIQFLRKRIPQLNIMLEPIEKPEDLAQLELKYLNESADWQSGKWMLDLDSIKEKDCACLETLIYSRIKSYIHRAVGWFDENEFTKSGFQLMKNLSTIYIHHTRDIKLEQDVPFTQPLFPVLESLTLIVGNRLGGLCSTTTENGNMQNGIQLEHVVVDSLLNVFRPTVTKLSLDMDVDHHHENGSIQLPVVVKNFPNLTYFKIEEWGPTDSDIVAIFSAFPKLETLMFCGRNLTDAGILGEVGKYEGGGLRGIRSLQCLQILTIFSVRIPPKNVFPWPIKENNNLTDQSFIKAFSQMALRKFHFLLKSEMITENGIWSLLDGPFSESNLEFSMNSLPQGIESVSDFQNIRDTFKYLDPGSTFLQPSNFVIPDIGKWAV